MSGRLDHLTIEWFSGDERKVQSRVLIAAAVVAASGQIVSSLGLTVAIPGGWVRWVGQAIGVTVVMGAFVVAALRDIDPRRLSVAFPLVAWATFTAFSWSAGGIDAPSIFSQTVLVFLTGLLLGSSWGWAFAGLSAVSTLGMAVAEVRGLLPVPSVVHTPMSRWVVLVTYLLVAAGLQAIYMARRRATLYEAETEVAQRRAGEEALRESESRYRALSGDLEKRVEERTVQLQSLNDDLAATVGELERKNEELAELNQQLDEATRAKSEFLASMSHELRTPLNSVIGFSGVMLQGMTGPLTEEQSRQLGMVNAAGRHLLGLVNQVLDLARIEAGQETLEVTEFAADAAAREAVDTVSPLAEAKGLQAVYRASDDVGEMRTDQARLRQILLNLLGNAVKFTSEGSITLKAARAGGDVLFTVSDTGPGIPPDELDLVFEEFYQSARTDAAKSAGTGLGLAVARRLAQMLGGEITASSVLGQGSAFVVRLPAVMPEPGGE